MVVTSLCRACNTTFTSVKAFDLHRVASYGKAVYAGKSHRVVGYTPHQRRCLTIEEMQALGMTQHEKGWWQMPGAQCMGAEEETEGMAVDARA